MKPPPVKLPVPLPLLRTLTSGTLIADELLERRLLTPIEREALDALRASLEDGIEKTKPKRTRKPKTKAKPSPRRSARKAKVRR